LNASVSQAIEHWFKDYGSDGEFICPQRDVPFSVIGPRDSSSMLVFATKPAIVSASLHSSELLEHLFLIGRYGLPQELDLLWITKIIKSRRILFLGDMDPVDLMIYAWLRDKLGDGKISYCGINDAYLTALDLFLPAHWTIPLSPSELISMPFIMQTIPDIETLVGEECFRLLCRGRKIEIEAVFNSDLVGNKLLMPLLK